MSSQSASSINQLELILLGACLGNRKLLESAEPGAMCGEEIAALIGELQEAARDGRAARQLDSLVKFLEERGCHLTEENVIDAIRERVALRARYQRGMRIYDALSRGAKALGEKQFIDWLKQSVERL